MFEVVDLIRPLDLVTDIELYTLVVKEVVCKLEHCLPRAQA